MSISFEKLARVREVLPQSGMRIWRVVIFAALPPLLAMACDMEVETKYGPHSGLVRGNLPSPPAVEAGPIDASGLCNGKGPIDAGPCSVTYTNDIWPKMSGTWKCSDATCHGGTANSPQLADQAGTYAALLTTMVTGLPYINPCSTDPTASAFVCNVSGATCSLQMPLANSTLSTGPMSPADIQLVTTWVQCGAPEN